MVFDVAAEYNGDILVQVNSDDADALRFLWLEDFNCAGKPDIYQMLVHIFGGKDLLSCGNYAVRRAASDHGSKYGEAVVKCVNRSFYMDDLLKSVETQEQTV